MSFIGQVISRLKRRQVAMAVDIYHITSRSNDLDTGKDVVTYNKIAIPRVIVLPPQAQLTLSQMPTGGFRFGGSVTTDTTTILVDGKDARGGLDFKVEDSYAVIKGKKYEIVGVQDFHFGEAYILRVKAVLGVIPNQISDRAFTDDLDFADSLEVA